LNATALKAKQLRISAEYVRVSARKGAIRVLLTNVTHALPIIEDIAEFGLKDVKSIHAWAKQRGMRGIGIKTWEHVIGELVKEARKNKPKLVRQDQPAAMDIRTWEAK